MGSEAEYHESGYSSGETRALVAPLLGLSAEDLGHGACVLAGCGPDGLLRLALPLLGRDAPVAALVGHARVLLEAASRLLDMAADRLEQD